MNGSTLVIGVGTNLGGRRSILRAARDLVAARFGARDLRVAPVWQTPPMGPPQPDYLNTAFALDFDGALADALERCLAVERALGRERRERWGPRTVDLDLLWHARRTSDTATLRVPHAGLRERTFALDPLLALVPDAVDPRDGEDLAAVRAAFGPVAAASPLGTGFDELARGADRADRLAAAAEADAARVVDPQTVPATVVSPIAVRWAGEASDAERLRRWLEAAGEHLDREHLALRRAAVFEDTAGLIRGVLIGARR